MLRSPTPPSFLRTLSVSRSHPLLAQHKVLVAQLLMAQPLMAQLLMAQLLVAQLLVAQLLVAQLLVARQAEAVYCRCRAASGLAGPSRCGVCTAPR